MVLGFVTWQEISSKLTRYDIPVGVFQVLVQRPLPMQWPPTRRETSGDPGALSAPGRDTDVVRLESVVSRFLLFGGSSASSVLVQLAIHPGTDRLAVADRTDWLVSMVEAVLNTPIR